MMGSGKSSIGKHLAASKKLSFIDMDRAIERDEGRTIISLFNSEGESHFRQLETTFLNELLESNTVTNSIISTGGGVVEKKENCNLLSQLGIIVYLRTTPKTLYLRLNEDTSRPLLSHQTSSNESMKTTIKNILIRREKKYEDVSNFVLDTDKKTIIQISAEIEQILTTTV